MLLNALFRTSFPLTRSPRPARRASMLVRAFQLGLALGAAVLLPGTAARAQDSTAAKPATPGVYTEEQAERGNGVFGKVCLECHTRNDMVGRDFRLNWNGRTVFDLFDRIRTTMPEAAPGSLTLAEYADVTSYFLKLNGMPAGSMPMPPDSTLLLIKLDIPPPPGQLTLRPTPSRAFPGAPSRAHARLVAPAPLRTDHTFLFRGF